jgi:hypothetical protein
VDYRRTYSNIIKKAKSENRIKLKKDDSNYCYYERHHILPKSLFPLWGQRNNKRNTVLLSAREHFFCHQLLDKIYPSNKMFLSLWILANDGRNNYCVKSSKEYEKLKIRNSKSYSEKLKKNHHLKNGVSEKTKLKISKSMKEHYKTGKSYWTGKKRTDDDKRKIGLNIRGRKWFTNGIIDRFVYECPVGFYCGRSNFKKRTSKKPSSIKFSF